MVSLLPTPYKKALLALVREDFSFSPGTQCQSDPCSLGRNTSHILEFPNLFWTAGPKALFGYRTLFQFTDFEKKPVPCIFQVYFVIAPNTRQTFSVLEKQSAKFALRLETKLGK